MWLKNIFVESDGKHQKSFLFAFILWSGMAVQRHNCKLVMTITTEQMETIIIEKGGR